MKRKLQKKNLRGKGHTPMYLMFLLRLKVIRQATAMRQKKNRILHTSHRKRDLRKSMREKAMPN